MAVHPLGSKSMLTRMCEEEKRTRKKASPLGILMELNKNKDKETGGETSEFYDQKLVEAYDQYKPRFHEMYPEDMDPLQYLLVKSLWTSTDPVKGRLAKGRIFGAGCSSVAAIVLVDDPIVVPSPPPTVDALEELRRRCEKRLCDEASSRAASSGEPTLVSHQYPFYGKLHGDWFVGPDGDDAHSTSVHAASTASSAEDPDVQPHPAAGTTPTPASAPAPSPVPASGDRVPTSGYPAQDDITRLD
ncbi:hypothetical protein LIER_24281 [Lithospermum erythrorhizon]|uniref:Uncharacterized protein n=1 Tax=Lithospermum erythrorhizon TaxID=34254 RepID=A0AAV3R1Z8_LITER